MWKVVTHDGEKLTTGEYAEAKVVEDLGVIGAAGFFKSRNGTYIVKGGITNRSGTRAMGTDYRKVVRTKKQAMAALQFIKGEINKDIVYNRRNGRGPQNLW